MAASSQDAQPEVVSVEPMPSSRQEVVRSKLPGAQYRKFRMVRRGIRAVLGAGVMTYIWYIIPSQPEKRQIVLDSVLEYQRKRQDFRGIVDMEIYDELEAVGRLQKRKRWHGEPMPSVNEAARELGFDVERYPWNYDKRPPVTPWWHYSTIYYNYMKKYYYTPEEIAEIDRLYSGI